MPRPPTASPARHGGTRPCSAHGAPSSIRPGRSSCTACTAWTSVVRRRWRCAPGASTRATWRAASKPAAPPACRCPRRSSTMKWVTREHPKIDRIACPWLIARFIDQEAEFLYVPGDEVLKIAEATGAVPYDVPGVEMGHVGELCSFDAFLA